MRPAERFITSLTASSKISARTVNLSRAPGWPETKRENSGSCGTKGGRTLELRNSLGSSGVHPPLLARFDYRLAEVIGQPVIVVIVFLANVFLKFARWISRNIPSHGPLLRICAGIVDCRFVVQRTFVRTREPFGDMHLVRVGVSVVIEPRPFVEAHHIDNEGIAFPITNGVAEPGLPLDRFALQMRTSIHVDLAPNVRSSLEDHNDSLQFRLLDDFHWIRRRKKTRAARRQAVTLGVVLGLVQRIVVVESGRPGLKRNPRLRGRSTALAPKRASLAAGSSRRRDHDDVPRAHVLNIGDLPDAQFTWNSTQIHRSIGQPRSRLTQQWIGSTTRSASSTLCGGRCTALALPGNEVDHRRGQQKKSRTHQPKKPSASYGTHWCNADSTLEAARFS